MKKHILKRVLAVISAFVLLSLAALPVSAVSYQPTDHYTVSADTPTCEEAILACGGSLHDAQKIYFQLPADDPEHSENNWTNHYNSADLGLDHCQVCVYWWEGIGSQWPDGSAVKWVGYKTKLIDADNRIYEAAVPPSEGTNVIIWNNGVYGGTDPTQEIARFAHQLKDACVAGAEPGDYDTLPAGSPNPDNMDGCIQIARNPAYYTAEFVHLDNRDFDWYVYYGDGCYGAYPTDSPDFHGQYASCVNPEHDHSAVVYRRGDADKDREITILDAAVIQRKLGQLKEGRA